MTTKNNQSQEPLGMVFPPYSEIQQNDNKDLREKIQALLKEVESKINPKFNYEVEHWENGNFDDSYQYGIDTGEQSTYEEIAHKLKNILE